MEGAEGAAIHTLAVDPGGTVHAAEEGGDLEGDQVTIKV